MTHGRGTFHWSLSSYQPVPPDVAEKVKEERERELEEERK
jgi:translation elongation factor EF-G